MMTQRGPSAPDVSFVDVSAWRKSESGRKRKYYRLTPAGYRALEYEKKQWLDVHGILAQLWGLQPELA